MIQRTEQLPYKETKKAGTLLFEEQKIEGIIRSKFIKAEYGECRTIFHQIPQYLNKEACDEAILR